MKESDRPWVLLKRPSSALEPLNVSLSGEERRGTNPKPQAAPAAPRSAKQPPHPKPHMNTGTASPPSAASSPAAGPLAASPTPFGPSLRGHSTATPTWKRTTRRRSTSTTRRRAFTGKRMTPPTRLRATGRLGTCSATTAARTSAPAATGAPIGPS